MLGLFPDKSLASAFKLLIENLHLQCAWSGEVTGKNSKSPFVVFTPVFFVFSLRKEVFSGGDRDLSQTLSWGWTTPFIWSRCRSAVVYRVISMPTFFHGSPVSPYFRHFLSRFHFLFGLKEETDRQKEGERECVCLRERERERERER